VKTCDTCGGDKVPAGMRGDTCPDCLAEIIMGSMIEEDDGDELFDDEHDHLDPLPTEPADDDLVTSDYLKFYRHGFRHKGPVVECREGDKWATAVEAYCDREKFWPDVWFVNERGDLDLIDMYEALHSEDDGFDFVRAGGDCVCSACGKKYYDHPYDERFRGPNDERYIKRLCDGRLVKL
jgi:hypothetical protein